MSYKITGYCDVDYAGDYDTHHSKTGCIFTLGLGAMSWCNKRQTMVSLSNTEVEYGATIMIAQECMWLMQLLQDLHQSFDYTVELYYDNQLTIKIAKNPIFHARTKHVDIHYHFIREKVLQGHIKMKYIKTKNQVIDMFTKGLSGSNFEKFRKQLSMTTRSKINGKKMLKGSIEKSPIFSSQ